MVKHRTNNLTKRITVHLFSLVIAILIFGCDSDIGNSADNPISPDISTPEETVTLVSNQDSIHQFNVGEAIQFDLSSMVNLSNNVELEINSIESLSDSATCDTVQSSGMQVKIDSFDQAAICQYRYTVKEKNGSAVYESDRMIAQVIVKNSPLAMRYSATYSLPSQSSVLTPIVLSLNSTSATSSLNINIKTQLASLYPTDANGVDYKLDTDVLILGNGTAQVDVSKSQALINYKVSSANDTGVTRIIYTLSDNNHSDFRVGVIDITVSDTDINQAPIAKYFEWDNSGGGIKLGTKYTIDLTSVIDPNDDCSTSGVAGSCISDADTTDKLQLVGIYAYDVTVAPTSPNDTDSTRFDATFTTTGIHDIVYYISDHKGGFAIGMMRVDIPHNIAPIFDGPQIIDVDAGDRTGKNVDLTSFVTDPEGKTVTLVSAVISAPATGKGAIRSLSGAAHTFNYLPETTTIGLVPVKVTFSDGEMMSVGDVIFNVSQISTLSLSASREVTTPVNTAVTINIADFLVGLNTGLGETVEVIEAIGSQIGSLTLSTPSNSNVTYTPNNNIYGVDDFAFTVKTNLGNQISGDIKVIIGDPPPIAISDIRISDSGVNTNLISINPISGIDCTTCNQSKYSYEWIINGETVSTDSSFTITKDQRSYIVVLIVLGEDNFGQKTYIKEAFDLFQMSLGSFSDPADSCQAIFDEYNSPYNLLIDDGEYWLKGHIDSTGVTKAYKTQCDMVSVAEAEELGKIHSGGYTLVWSYSQETNMNRFNYNSATVGSMNQNLKGVEWGDPLIAAGRGIVAKETGTVNYNDFRITQAEANRFGNSIVRISYTSDPSVDTIDVDPDDTVKNWSVQTTGDVSFTVFPYHNSNGHNLVGKFDGYEFRNVARNNFRDSTLYLNGDNIGNAIYYNDGYGWHIYVAYFGWATRQRGISKLFGFWGHNNHDGVDLMYKCKQPTNTPIGGFTALGCNNGDYYGTTITKHSNINGGEGYVVQWWIR